MKPTFALDLTRDTVALLHRTPKGWLLIGEVAFDAPDLEEALDYLRKTALGLSPMGMATKIILPASQILYTEVHAPGPSRDEKRRQIAAGLEGRTPYPVEDLVFDWSGKGATVKVAVVARETLEEAEGFAIVHRLNPVSFVAIPEEGTFVGEAWFGPTAAAASILASGEKVERDRDPVTILHRELPSAAPAEVTTETQAASAGTGGAEAAAPTTPAPLADDAPLPGLEEALNADLPDFEPASSERSETAPEALGAEDLTDQPLTTESLTPDLDQQGDTLPGGQVPELASEASLQDTLEAELAREFAAAKTGADIPVSDTSASAAVPVAAASGTDADEAPFAHVTDTVAFPDGEDDRPAAAEKPTNVLDDEDADLPPALPSAAMVAFASRRAAGGAGVVLPPAPSRPVEGATRSDAGSGPGAKLGAAAARATAAKGMSGPVTAPTIPGTRVKPKAKLAVGDIPRPVVGGPTTVKSPARPGGTFGTSAPPRNRSGIVFMVLVALLLLFLALVGAWSSFYLARGNDDTGLTVDVTTNGVADSVPGIDDEMLADMQDPEGMMDPLPEAAASTDTVGAAAALATESLPAEIAGQADPEPSTNTLAEAVDPSAGEAATEIAATVSEDAIAEDALAETAVETAVETVAAPEAEALAEVEPSSLTEVAAVPAPEAGPEPAPDTTVTTELSAAPALVEDQDEIFLSAMDTPPPALDALALPTPIPTADTLPEASMPPPPFGTVYQFDANGMLKPTPAGILSPEGVMLIAGKPPLLPPSRSEAAATLAAAAAPPQELPQELPDEAAAGAVADASADVPTAADASLVTAGEVTPEAAEILPAPADPALAGFRPRARPAGLVPAATDPAVADDDARLATDGGSDVATLRPLPRPASVIAVASASRPAAEPAVVALGAQGASLAAQAEAQLAAAAAIEAQNPSVVAISMRPSARPRDLSRAVEAAVAAAVRAADPEPEVIVAAAAAPAPELKPEELDELDEPETAQVAPSIPTKASVAKQATYTKAINLKKLNLIGTYGTDSRRYALIRQSNGSYKKVRVGDKIDGGTIKAITETEVRYQKGGKLLSLTMPKA
ncbi:hypothetical protein [Tabrizicola sp.]|uniref:hypothetical protein n=1 Tax=Tabrizicola sp. TaxID=2005166 RepID=UPI00260756C7|nr:hypothetical protein [Tabrizicola sp.]MDM7933453.1 hypothetical protein [Tabrizicola sp.]